MFNGLMDNDEAKRNYQNMYYGGDSEMLAIINFLMSLSKQAYPQVTSENTYHSALYLLLSSDLILILEQKPPEIYLTEKGKAVVASLKARIAEQYYFKDAIGELFFYIYNCVSDPEKTRTEVDLITKHSDACPRCNDNIPLYTIRAFLVELDSINQNHLLGASGVQGDIPALLRSSNEATLFNLQPFFKSILSDSINSKLGPFVAALRNNVINNNVPSAISVIDKFLSKNLLSKQPPIHIQAASAFDQKAAAEQSELATLNNKPSPPTEFKRKYDRLIEGCIVRDYDDDGNMVKAKIGEKVIVFPSNPLGKVAKGVFQGLVNDGGKAFTKTEIEDALEKYHQKKTNAKRIIEIMEAAVIQAKFGQLFKGHDKPKVFTHDPGQSAQGNQQYITKLTFEDE